jgi:hypothetical protein
MRPFRLAAVKILLTMALFSAVPTPSQTPTHLSAIPATHMRGSPLHTPSWSSALPGTLSPSSARTHLQATSFKDTDTKRLPGGQTATVAGYAGPGFHTWPPGHTPQNRDPNPLLRNRSTAQKSFGETFGAATGVSDPRLQKTRIRNAYPDGRAATVAGYAGPGFHNWPSGHTPQDNGRESIDTNPVSWTPHPRPPPIDPPSRRHMWVSRV